MTKKFKFLNDGPYIEPPNISEVDVTDKLSIIKMLKKNLQLSMLEQRYNGVINILALNNNIIIHTKANLTTYNIQNFIKTTAGNVISNLTTEQFERAMSGMLQNISGFQKKIILLNRAIYDIVDDFQAHYNMVYQQGYSRQQSLNSAFYNAANQYRSKISVIDELSGADIFLEAEIHKAYPRNPDKGKRLIKYLEYKYME